ncbi:hypothetical protein RCTIPTONUS_135 [Rhodobacter phage RcTiptonus]|nr:hypothetical protein RCTIPTONUS_135 [Rhodobacter phage RcTiptonus]
MARSFEVCVGYLTNGDTHPLLAFVRDAEDGRPLTDATNHRDMGQVRCYFNGWLHAIQKMNPSREVSLTLPIHQRPSLPADVRVYDIPVNMTFDYLEDRIPPELL